MPKSKAHGSVIVGYDGWFELELQALTGLGLPDDFLAGPRWLVLSTIASLFLHPDFTDEFSQAMAWLALVESYEEPPHDCELDCRLALQAIDDKMAVLAGLTTPFARRNLLPFVEFVTSHASKPDSNWTGMRLAFNDEATYDGDISRLLPAIALEHTSLIARRADFYDRAVARLALWAAGAQVPLSKADYTELTMTVGYPYQAWRKSNLTNPRARMALYVLEHARLRARIEGIVEEKR